MKSPPWIHSITGSGVSSGAVRSTLRGTKTFSVPRGDDVIITSSCWKHSSITQQASPRNRSVMNLLLSDWIDVTGVIICSCVFLLLSDYIRNKAPKNFPPGPWSLPFIGDLHHIENGRIHLQFSQFAEKYGKVFSLRILGSRIVVLDGYKLVKEVYLRHDDSLAGRPVLPLFYDIVGDKGLVAACGYKWKQQRRFALSTLRNFGLGKKSLEPSISLECCFLNEAISNEQGRAFDPRSVLSNAVANVICVLVFGDRFEYSDSGFQSLLKDINEAVYLQGGVCAQVLHLNIFTYKAL